MEKKPIKASPNKKTGLGRGIDALFSENNNHQNISSLINNTKQVIEIPITQIIQNPHQPRKYFEKEKIEELSSSIRAHGILEPLLVSKDKEQEHKYVIIAGERRYRAAKEIPLNTVPALVLSVSEEEKLEIAMIENLQRENLNPIETAVAFKNILTINNTTQEDLAKKLGISRPVVANTIRLLSLPEEIQESIKTQKISQSHARLLLSIKNKQEQKKRFHALLSKKVSVKTLENTISNSHSSTPSPMASYEQKIIELLGTKVSVKGTINKGVINISYYNQEDLTRILQILNVTLD